MKEIVFATTNEGKLKEARDILGIEIEGSPLEIDEVQSLDPEEVAVKKAKAYFKKLKKPLIIEDVSLVFNALKTLPGTYIDDFFKYLGNDGLIKLITSDRRATAITTIVHMDENGSHYIFQGKVKGKIAEIPRGEKGFGWDSIFIPEGEERTFAEMELEEKNEYSMRRIALMKFKAWLEKTA